mmetsp:Transcript_15525/g.33684  ORF Transcript_15525/g.33684 Transcript_15525/m.33684 type:complete len:263 (-) Transcript_15525:812-1600(-)
MQRSWEVQVLEIESLWQTFTEKNTFLDYDTTQSALLPDDVRAQLRFSRGFRRAKSCEPRLAQDEDNQVDRYNSVGSGSGASVSTTASLMNSSSKSQRQSCQGEQNGCGEDYEISPMVATAVQSQDYMDNEPCVSKAATWPIANTEPGATSNRACGNVEGSVVLRLQDSVDWQHSRPIRREDVPTTVSELPHGVPSIGSLGHHLGKCKPCAFLDSRMGCVSGYNCKYCHICDRGEKKRRQKEKRRMMTLMRRAEAAANPIQAL